MTLSRGMRQVKGIAARDPCRHKLYNGVDRFHSTGREMKTSAFTLRSKITAAFLLPTLLILLLYGLITYFASRQGLEDELGKRLVSIGVTVSAGMSDGFDAKQLERLDADKTRVIARIREKLEDVRQQTGVRRVFLFDRELQSLVDTEEDIAFGDKLYALEQDRVEIGRAFDEVRSTTSVLYEGRDGMLYKTAYVPVRLEDETVAVLGVEGSAEYFDLLTDFATVLTVLSFMGILLVIVVSTLVSRRITRPVNDLVEAARRLGRGDYEAAVLAAEDAQGHDDSKADEIQFLASVFDEMRRDVVRRDRQMQMMLSGIAHEVRNPLGGMKLFVGLLEEDLRERNSDADELEKVERIQRELDYLERVVADFLDFARDAPLDRERFSGRDFVDEVRDLLSAECRDAGCDFETDVDPDEVEVTADRGKLRRAVINCIRNAHQAIEGEGTIRLSIRDEGAMRKIIVEDDGPGIPEDKLDEVLTPFFTTKEKGSGLGLSLTRRIMEDHGGTMTIESENGSGTVVEFTIPFDDEVEAAADDTIPEGWLG